MKTSSFVKGFMSLIYVKKNQGFAQFVMYAVNKSANNFNLVKK